MLPMARSPSRRKQDKPKREWRASLALLALPGVGLSAYAAIGEQQWEAAIAFYLLAIFGGAVPWAEKLFARVSPTEGLETQVRMNDPNADEGAREPAPPPAAQTPRLGAQSSRSTGTERDAG